MYVFEFAGEDDPFARFEAACVAADVRQRGPGIALAADIGSRIDQLAYTRSIDEYLADTPLTVAAARRALRDVSLERSGSAAVRARSVRGADLDTQRLERELGDVLVDRGFSIDLEAPDHELRALGTGDACVLAWHVRDLDHGFSERQPTDRPFFRPGSMAPRLARAIVNIAGAGPSRRILDPMCGTGGFLIEAALVGATPLGGDVDEAMLRGTRTNLATFAPETAPGLFRGDAAAWPIRSDRIDAVVFDAPYGRQSAVASETPTRLVAEALEEAGRVTDRAVVVTDRDLDADATGWRLHAKFERRVHRSLTRYVHVLGPPTAFPSPPDRDS